MIIFECIFGITHLGTEHFISVLNPGYVSFFIPTGKFMQIHISKYVAKDEKERREIINKLRLHYANIENGMTNEQRLQFYDDFMFNKVRSEYPIYISEKDNG